MRIRSRKKRNRYTLPQSNTKIPKWLAEDYQGDEQDFTNWLVDMFMSTLNEKQRKNLMNKQVYERINAEANYWAMDRTKRIQDKAQRAFLFQTVQADKTGWYHFLGNNLEFDTIEELLASLTDAAEEGSSEAYDLAFITKTVVPLIEQSGGKPSDIWSLPFQVHKTRMIVPALRNILQCPVCGTRSFNGTTCRNGHPIEMTKEKKETAISLTALVNQNTVDAEIKEKVSEIVGRKKYIAPKSVDEGEKYMLPGGKEMIVILCDYPEQTRAIEIALRGVVSNGFSYKSLFAFGARIQEHLLGVKMSVEDYQKYTEEYQHVRDNNSAW